MRVLLPIISANARIITALNAENEAHNLRKGAISLLKAKILGVVPRKKSNR
jgi:hypothetical protein